MEIKIGVKDTPRELVVSSSQTPEAIEKLTADALKESDGLLRLADDRGRIYIVPADRIAYIEIAPADSRRVGFSVSA